MKEKKQIIAVTMEGRGYCCSKFTAWDSIEVTEEERAARERVKY